MSYTYATAVDPYKMRFMKDTEIFHLGDEYYVYINWEVKIEIVSITDNLAEWGRYTSAWVGESFVDAVVINNARLNTCKYQLIHSSFDALSVIDASKLEEAIADMGEIILKYREQLKELIMEKEYWDHLYNSNV